MMNQTFICYVCLHEPLEPRAVEADNRLTIMFGKLVCVEHIPRLVKIEKDAENRRMSRMARSR